jgi:hypothetical protein
LVLQGADGVAFIADSQISETQNNAAAFLDLRENLSAHGIKMREIPLVIQFNKRDVPNRRTDDEISQLASKGREPVFPAVATQGKGVLETFVSLLHLTWVSLDAVHDLSGKFRFDSNVFLQQVLARMGANSTIEQILDSRLGGDFEARRKEVSG